MVFDVLPGCAQLAVAADAAAEDDGFAGVSEAELVGIMCAWDRVEAHAAARKLAAVAELARRNPGPEDAEFTADQIANALGESRFRADELTGTAGSPGHPPARHAGGAARRHGADDASTNSSAHQIYGSSARMLRDARREQLATPGERRLLHARPLWPSATLTLPPARSAWRRPNRRMATSGSYHGW